MFTSHCNYTTDSLKQSTPIINQYFILWIYAQNNLLKIPVIQVQSNKLMDIWIKGLVLHQWGIFYQNTRKYIQKIKIDQGGDILRILRKKYL